MTASELASPQDFDRWQALVEQGIDPSTAARQVGRKGSSAFRRTDAARHQAVLQIWRDQKETQVDDVVERRALEPDSPPAILGMWAKRHHPGYRDKQQLEVTGEDGGPVVVEDRSASLVEVVRVLRTMGALPEGDEAA